MESAVLSKTAIRDAATVILVRDKATQPRVLMGQRGASAAFMPNKFVFPGGAVDAGDKTVPMATPISEPSASRLGKGAPEGAAAALCAAAIRELWEETGLVMGEAGNWQGPVTPDWLGFAGTGHRPSAAPLHFVFRAITPPGRPRRFDARFFVADAGALASDPDDFSAASDELSHLQWISLDEVRQFNLPFITEVVLAEVAAALPRIGAPETVPFFNNTDEQSLFERLGGQGPLRH